MNILITGGAGFIGSHLCRRLLRAGNRIYCVDNLITGNEANLKEIRDHKDFVFMRHDICELSHMEQPLDWVLHFASPASPKDYLKFPVETLKVNTLGTLNCLEIARAQNAKFLLASTSEVYGDPEVSPQSEGYWGHVNPIGLRSCYDEGKRAAEAFSFAYHRTCGVAIHVIRIFNTYGPGMRVEDGRVVSNFIVQALRGEDITVYGDGTQTRSFCYIDDLIEGIVSYLNIDHPGPINLGATFEFTVLELANKIVDLTGSRSRIRFEPLPEDDPVRRKPDDTKAKALLGWNPRVDLDAGLKKTIPFFEESLRGHGSRPRIGTTDGDPS